MPTRSGYPALQAGFVKWPLVARELRGSWKWEVSRAQEPPPQTRSCPNG